MALSYKTRRRWSVIILLIGLPLYIFVTLALIGLANDQWWSGPGERMPFWLELVVFIGLGLVWALPCKRIFLGVGQADPDADQPGDRP